MIELTTDPIDPAAVTARVRSPLAGAVVLFLGATRQVTAGRTTLWLDYECYLEMTTKQLSALEHEARGRWNLIECAIVHRLGRVDVGEVSMAVAVSSPHRRSAFAAGEWLIDQIKQQVPIWKQEHWDNGESEWIHPA